MGFYRNIRIKIRKCQEGDEKFFNEILKELDEKIQEILEKHFEEDDSE